MAPPPPPPPRILLAGDPLGRLQALFKRVASVNKSTGPFDALLCVGQFFSDSSGHDLGELSDYLEGRAAVPIPTYFTGGYGGGAPAARLLSAAVGGGLGFKADGVEICPNLYWLRGSGKFSLHGLSVVYLSGKRSDEAGGMGHYTVDDVDALRAVAEEPGIVDLFLTNEWPSGVANEANTSDALPQVLDPSGCDPTLSDLVSEIKPRYHIAGTKDVFYAREPYKSEGAVHVTRFIGLATVGNKAKQRFIHAISPSPASSMSAADISTRPANTTGSPYKAMEAKSNKAKEEADDESKSTKRGATVDDAQYWRYDVSNRNKRQRQSEGRGLCFKFTSTGSCPRGHQCNFTHDEDAREQYLRNVCFDFLNKGKCERGPDCKFSHNLADEGAASLSRRISRSDRRTESSCWFCLSGPDVESHLVISIGENYYCALAKGPLVPDHVLIVPIEHSPNTLAVAPPSESELESYKGSLASYFIKQDKVLVYFEFVSQNTRHANLQAIPIPMSKASNVQKIFNLAAKRLDFEFTVVNPEDDSREGRKALRSKFDGKSSLFYVEMPEGKILLHTIDDDEKFPVQFGREVIAGLLGKPDRADWRNCKLSMDEETQMVERFKLGFHDFDPAP